MKTAASYGTGRYQSGQKDVQIWPRILPVVRHGIIAFHGRGADATQFEPGWNVGDHAQALGDAGMPVISIDAGGTLTYGNNASLTSATNAYNYLTGTLGCTAKVGLLAWSMGSLVALNWLKANAAKVAAVHLFAPPTDLDALHGNATYTAEIDTAYGSNYAANGVGHSPIAEPATWRGGPKIRIVHGLQDTTVAPSMSRAFRDAVNDPSVELIEVAGDHQGVFSNHPWQSTVDFFKGAPW
jgi:hypothetical protein